MLKFYADKFVRLAAALEGIERMFKGPRPNPDTREKDDIEWLKAFLSREGLPVLESIGLRFSRKKCQEIINLPPVYSIDDYREKLADLSSRIKHELEDGNYLFLTEQETKFFDPKEPLFGTAFETAFPSASFDLDEAAKCLALGRHTAAAFHLMRVTEIGVEALRLCLGIPAPVKDADRNWGNALRKVREAIEARKNANPLKADDKTLIPEIYACLDSVRVAWRNDTMHVENKYTPDETEHLFVVVRGFMKRASSRMDEKGQPLA